LISSFGLKIESPTSISTNRAVALVKLLKIMPF